MDTSEVEIYIKNHGDKNEEWLNSLFPVCGKTSSYITYTCNICNTLHDTRLDSLKCNQCNRYYKSCENEHIEERKECPYCFSTNITKLS